MSDQFLAEIRVFPLNFAPLGWASCDGQLLPISQNTALFSLLGTYYGGDGKSNFALPNLNGRTPIGAGQGTGLSDYSLGDMGGADSVTLLTNEIPYHTHLVRTAAGAGNTDDPAQAVALAHSSIRAPAYATTTNGSMAATTLPLQGGGQPHNNLPPSLVLWFCIALQGIFPPRS